MFQILVVTFAQLTTNRPALGYEYTEYASPVRHLRPPREDSTGSDHFTCKKPGRFPNPKNCSQYYLCVQITPSQIYLSYMTCPNALVFDPEAQYCTTTDKLHLSVHNYNYRDPKCMDRSRILLQQ
jgi:hypothetical protein